MNVSDLLPLGLFCLLLLALTKPAGLWLRHVLDSGRVGVWDRILGPLERGIYRLLGVDASRSFGWKEWVWAILLFNGVGCLLTFGLLMLQGVLPLNPQGFGGLSWHLALNTAVSFTTNTNWQSYGGESTLSHLSQMLALVPHNFASAATGLVVAAALGRSLGRDQRDLGNPWVDLVRVHTRLLVPLSIVFALFLVGQGIVQTWTTTLALTGPGGFLQNLSLGPVASQVAIKMLGTNGGGYFNANAAHPFENPTELSNFVQILSIFLLPAGLVWWYGDRVRDRKHGWTIWAVMFGLFLAGTLAIWASELHGNPRLEALGIDQTMGSWEGKEVRFGMFGSSLFAAVTTDASCGAVNAMHASLTPLGGLVTLFNMHLGEVVFGGVGSGLYGMIVFALLSVFLSGLMVGRSPEILGRRIGVFEVQMVALAILAQSATLLVASALATVSDAGRAGLLNHGPHGFSEILYAATSAVANNGSAFAGLTANSPFWNTLLAVCMFLGRYAVLVPALALAGSLSRSRLVAEGPGSFPVRGAWWGLVLVATIVLVGALTYLPALAIGPLLEHVLMISTSITF